MKTNFRHSSMNLLSGAMIGLAVMLLIGNPRTASAQWSTAANGTDIYKTNTAGNIGIGTTGPNQKVQIIGTSGAPASTTGMLGIGDPTVGGSSGGAITMGYLTGSYSYMQGWGGKPLYVNPLGNDVIFNRDGGNVGIGTTSPGDRLVVEKSSAESAITINADAAQQAVLYFSSAGTKKTAIYRPPSSNDLRFNIVGVGDALTIQSSTGNVGIGTTTPGSKLEVAGNIAVNGTSAGNITASGTITGGNIVAKYQDVAEWVPSSQQVAPATVVVLDPTKTNQVISSSEAYDTRVAGVVSEQPGIALGERGTGKVLVATTGRVLVKVDASRDPIHIGDLLVTSDIPGLAMKSEPVTLGSVRLHQPGTLIGKALEPLEKGSGKILVLLSLQ